MDERWPQTFWPFMTDLMDKTDKAAKLGDEAASKMYL